MASARSAAAAPSTSAAASAAAPLATAGAAQQQPQQGPEAGEGLLTLADQAQLVQGEAGVLREGLRAARRQLATLQRQLLSLHRQALRQQSVLGTLLVEQVGSRPRCAAPRRGVHLAPSGAAAAATRRTRCPASGVPWSRHTGAHCARPKRASLPAPEAACTRRLSAQSVQCIARPGPPPQECEAKLARSEAEAYRTAARARTAAVGALQRCAGSASG